jgi:transcriptional regulator with XRE-family HTH domain
MSSGSHGPAVERALLSAELKRLRSVSGETQEAVAAACEWSIAKFSRIENGTSAVRKADLESLLRHCNVDEKHINELTQRAREARAPGWWEDYDFGADKGFEAYVGYEDGASSIRMFQPLVVPGLLQVPQYTWQTMEAWGIPPEVIGKGIKLREERQQRVAMRAPVQYYVLDEAVIRRPSGSAMRDQLEHLIRISQKPNVTIRIIPFARGPHFGLRGPFVLLGFDGPLDDVLYLESARRGDLLIAETKDQFAGPNVPKVEDPADEVANYQDNYTRLLKTSLDADESRELIRHAIQQAPPSPSEG